jgi:3-phosphoshikimate 1-carboxyvinyltransferase
MTAAMLSSPAPALAGSVRVPGDKSISHRALILGALAVGETTIDGLLEAEDVLATAAALSRCGVEIVRDGGGWRIHGLGVGGLREPAAVLDMGNSGTGARLLIGVAAAHPFITFFTGDASLTGRPMARVIEPLTRMGAEFRARSGQRLPLAVCGPQTLLPIAYRLPVASAQVKSAVLLAGLNAPGRTTVVEPAPSRDHTERLLRSFGAEITVDDLGAEGRRITLVGQPELSGRPVRVPGDVSSAAFPLVAALIIPGSKVRLEGVGVNPLRTGLIDSLREMGARIEIARTREEGGEPVADLIAEASDLIGIDVPAERVPAMIDEFPIFAIAAACARGVTRMHGLAELRVKESDRLAAIAGGLAACGVPVETGADRLTVRGAGGLPEGGGTVAVHLDHRIAMAFLVLGMAARRPVTVDDAEPIRTSFPDFVPLMTALGARLERRPSEAA